MTLRLKGFAILTTLVAIGMAIGAVVFGASDARTQTDTDIRISLLEKPAVAADALPDAVINSPTADLFANPAAARLAFNGEGRRVYVVPGAQDTLCRVVVTGAGPNPTIVTGCPARSLLATKPPVLTYQETEGAAVLAVAVIPDGFDTARTGQDTVPIKNNVFSAVLPKSVRTVEVSGPAGTVQLSLNDTVR